MCRGSHLKIISSMRRVRKQAKETALVCGFMVSLSVRIPKFLAWLEGVDVDPRLNGHQEAFHVLLLLLKVSTSVLSVFKCRQLFFTQLAMFVMHLRKLVLVVIGSSVSEKMSWVLSALEIMLRPWHLTMLANGVIYALKSLWLRDEPWGTPQVISLGSDMNGGRWILSALPVKKEGIHLSAPTWMPMWWSVSISVWWDTVLKDAKRLRRIKAAVSPWSRRVQMSSVAAIRVVSVL